MTEKSKSKEAPFAEIEELKLRLEETEETLNAVRRGEVDAIIGSSPDGQIYTLQGAEHPYRVFFEAMHEGAVTMTPTGLILYCNHRFAELVQTPHEEVNGTSFLDFVSLDARQSVIELLSKVGEESHSIETSLLVRGGSVLPINISASPFTTEDMEAVCVIVTDLSHLGMFQDLETANEELKASKQHLLAANTLLLDSRLAALNVMEDALAARKQAEETSAVLRDEIAQRKQTEEELRRTKDGLQVIIAEKTAALRHANRILEDEISERIEIENNLKTTNALLKLLSKTFSRREYLDSLVTLLGEFCGCECVGIRIAAESGDFPYVAAEGFSKEFIEQEGLLRIGSDSCVCTRIAQGQPEESEASFITPAGSFVCNDSPCLLNPRENGNIATYRAACAQQGFFSLAVIPVRYRNEIKVIIHLADKRTGIFSEQIISLIESLAPLIGEALQRFDVEEELVASREQLRRLSIHLVSAREEERLRVAREIHDDLGQTLTAASMELGMLKKTGIRPDSVADKTVAAKELIDTAIEDIHRICAELRPRILDHLGLRAAIEWQARRFAERAGLDCFLDLQQVELTLPTLVSTSLFRIFQECLTNIVRHAKASQVFVRLAATAAELVLEVRDNGKGIPKHRVAGKDSFGLIGIRERVHQLGGKVTFKGAKNSGTTVTVTVPLIKGAYDA